MLRETTYSGLHQKNIGSIWTLAENSWIKDSAFSVVQEIFQLVGNLDIAVLLVNPNGTILKMLARDEIINVLAPCGIQVGGCLAEKIAGHNPFATTISQLKPSAGWGTDRSRPVLRGWFAASSPFFAPNGVPLGAIGMAGLNVLGHDQSLAIVDAGARAIETHSAIRLQEILPSQPVSQATYTLSHLTGSSAAICRVRRAVNKVAPAQANVLIHGETGTGKGMLARIVHAQSKVKNGPFIDFPCEATPRALIVPELFGYRDSSPAVGREPGPGRFELAEGGTLLLQDIEMLPLEAQAILLEVLETGVYCPAGGEQPVCFQVRIIACTASDLDRRVAEGSFLPELLYRLRGYEIAMPALRERKADIPALADCILQRITRPRHGSLSLARATVSIMTNYDWPGNVRELEAVLESACANVQPFPLICPEHLPERLQSTFRSTYAAQSGSQALLDTYQRKAVLQAAVDCQGKISQMAQVLGISRTTLWRWLKRLEIELTPFQQK